MAVDVLDFAKDVEYGRKRLVDNAKKFGLAAGDNTSLQNAISMNLSLMSDSDAFGAEYRVRWFGPDGEYRIDYLKEGDSIPEAPTNTNYDPEYLEFVRWAKTSDDTVIHKDIDCGAIYRVKPDADGKRWTHLFINLFDENYLTPSLKLYKGTTTSTMLIDWGDGSELESPTDINTTVTHTYNTTGKYIIKIWCDYNGWSNFKPKTQGSPILYGSNYNKCLYKFYAGDNFTLWCHCFESQYALETFIFSESVTGISSCCFSNCMRLNYIIIPNTVQTNNQYSSGIYIFRCNYSMSHFMVEKDAGIFKSSWSPAHFTDNEFYGATEFIIPDGATRIPHMDGMLITKIRIPNTVVQTYFAIQSCKNLTEIIFEENTQLNTLEYALNSCISLQRINLLNLSNLQNMTHCLQNCTALQEVYVPSTVTTFLSPFTGCTNLKYIGLYSNFDFNLDLTKDYALTVKCLYNMYVNLKDLTGFATKTIKFATQLKTALLLNGINVLGELVSSDSADFKQSLLDCFASKNWTVTFV